MSSPSSPIPVSDLATPPPTGPLGPRSLLDLSRAVMMRSADRYSHIGDLQFHQHPIFFTSRQSEQLAELEGNSPGIKKDTDHLWEAFVAKRRPKFQISNKALPKPRGWRKVYKEVLKKEEEDYQTSVQSVRAIYKQEEEERAERRIKTTSKLGGKPKKSWGIKKPSTSLVQKARQQTLSNPKRSPPRSFSHLSHSRPAEPVDPFRKCTMLEYLQPESSAALASTGAGEERRGRFELPPTPVGAVSVTDGFAVGRVVRPPTIRKPVEKKEEGKREEREKATLDSAFFGGAGGGVRKAVTRVVQHPTAGSSSSSSAAGKSTINNNNAASSSSSTKPIARLPPSPPRNHTTRNLPPTGTTTRLPSPPGMRALGAGRSSISPPLGGEGKGKRKAKDQDPVASRAGAAGVGGNGRTGGSGSPARVLQGGVVGAAVVGKAKGSLGSLFMPKKRRVA